MKKLVLALLMMGISSLTLAVQAKTVCETRAEAAVAKFVQAQDKDYYDQDGFYAYECVLAPNKKAVLCDVSASKGDGAANDSYLAVLNESCTRAYRVQLTGEE